MIAVPAAAVGAHGFLPDHIAAALAYLTPIPAIVFLRLKPFNRIPFVRFHALQSIFLALASVVLAFVVRIVFWLMSFVPRFGYLLASLTVLLAVLGWLILWLVVIVKALQHERFMLPVIGSLADGM